MPRGETLASIADAHRETIGKRMIMLSPHSRRRGPGNVREPVSGVLTWMARVKLEVRRRLRRQVFKARHGWVWGVFVASLDDVDSERDFLSSWDRPDHDAKSGTEMRFANSEEHLK